MPRLRERRTEDPHPTAAFLLIAAIILLGVLVFILPFVGPPSPVTAPQFILPFQSTNYLLSVVFSQVEGTFQSASYALSLVTDPIAGSAQSTSFALTLTGTLISQAAPANQPPDCDTLIASPASPAAFSPDLVVTFEITCSDGVGISEAVLSFDTSQRRYTAGQVQRDGDAFNAVYSASIIAPAPGAHQWSWTVTNRDGQSFTSSVEVYSVTAAAATTSLFIDGQASDQRYPRRVFAVISANSSDAALTTNIEANTTGDFVTIASGTGTVTQVIDTTDLDPGTYLFRASTPGGLGFSASQPVELILEVSNLTLNSETVIPPSGLATFSPNTTYLWESSWSGSISIMDFDISSPDFTPPPAPVDRDDNLFTTNYTGLPAGSYTYQWSALEGGTGRTTTTPPLPYEILRVPTSVRLELDGVEGTNTYTMTDTANLFAEIDVPGKEVCINITNSIVFASDCGIGNVTLSHFLDLSGSFKATAFFPGDQNFAASQVTHDLMVDPLWTELDATPDSPVTHSPTQLYSFSVTWAFAPGDVMFEWQGANRTPSPGPLGGNAYEQSFLGLAAGTYTWRWWALKSDTNTWIATPLFNYTVNKIVTTTTLTLDGQESDRIYQNDTQAEIVGTVDVNRQVCLTIQPAPPGPPPWSPQTQCATGTISRNVQMTTSATFTDYEVSASFVGDANRTASNQTWHAIVMTFNDTEAPELQFQDQSSPAPAQLEPVNLTTEWSDNVFITDAVLEVDVGETGTFADFATVRIGAASGPADFVWSDPSVSVGTTVAWRVRVTDIAGNTATSGVETFTVTAPIQGQLTVTTEPFDAVVFIDGQAIGLAPQTLLLDPGIYTISFETVAGFDTPLMQTVTVTEGATISISAVYTSRRYPVAITQAQSLLNGVPTSAFSRGDTMEVETAITNTGRTVQPVIFAITVRDPNFVLLPPSPALVLLTLAPGQTLAPEIPFDIPLDAPAGTWTVTTATLTDFPVLGGFPVGLPAQFTFTVS